MHTKKRHVPYLFRSSRIPLSFLLAGALIVAACSGDESGVDVDGSGGASAGLGGESSTGGAEDGSGGESNTTGGSGDGSGGKKNTGGSDDGSGGKTNTGGSDDGSGGKTNTGGAEQGTGGAVSTGGTTNEEPSSRPPNILLIIADDLGVEATSLYPQYAGDSGQVPIPNLEALAEEGVVFENTWASPMCSPTRATIVSGLYGHRTGVTTAGNVLPTSTVTVFDRVAAESTSDYGLALFGKYHLAGNSSTDLGHVRDLGIPVFKGYMGHSLGNPYTWTAVDLNGPAVEQSTFATTVITDFTVDFIKEHESAHPENPWFVVESHSGVHQSSNYVPPADLHSIDLGELVPGELSNTVVNYQALIQSLDTEIGRLLEEIDLEKTTVIFIGDNGTASSVKDTGTGVRGSKTSVYEGGVKVPLIIAGAGVTRRGREDALVTSTDLYATVLALAGISVTHVNNSYSLKPLLTDAEASTGRTHSFTELCNGTNTRRYAIRDQRYKLLVDGDVLGLYDLVSDPLETKNLYENADHAAIRATLEAEIETLKADATAGCFR